MNPLPSNKKLSTRAFMIGLRYLVAAKGGFLARRSARFIASLALAGWVTLGSGLVFILAATSALRGLLEMNIWGGPTKMPPGPLSSHAEMGAALAGALMLVGAGALSRQQTSWRARRIALEISGSVMFTFARRFATRVLLPFTKMGLGVMRAIMQVEEVINGSASSLDFRSALLVLATPLLAGGIGAMFVVATAPLVLAMALSMIVEIKKDVGVWRSSSNGAGIKSAVAVWVRESAEKIESHGRSSKAYAQKEREDLDRETSTSKAKAPPPRL